ncbi:uncharacterized protein LOC135490705 [Lineus longissimus]|uniref:uncharacterized protein LOC135490705 n=1 Tax=Lineus longissimus TaxID=88925 RepID=UPI002B4D4650
MAAIRSYTETDVNNLVDLPSGIAFCIQHNIEYDDLENVDEIKERARRNLLGRIAPDCRTEMQEKFRGFTARDAGLRTLHCSVYEELLHFFSLEQCTDDVIQLVNMAVPYCEDKIVQNYNRFKDNGCPILVAGESGAGKSSFLNLLIGSKINPVDDSLNATSTICELHNDDNKADAEITYGPHHPEINKGKNREILSLDIQNPESAQKLLQRYTIGQDRTRRIYDLIKIHWPIPMLQGKVFLVDSPGVGESKAMSEKVLSYLPKAAAFIYIINCSINGGGISEGRLEVLLEPVTNQKDVEELQVFNPESAIFVLNQWDEVENSARENVRRRNINKLKRLWPGLKEEKQVYCLSVKEAQKKLDMGGGETREYKALLDGLYHFMETSLNLTIDNHHRWLSFVHGRLLNIVQTNFTSAKRTRHQNAMLGKETKEKLDQLKEEADNVIGTLEEKLKTKMDEIAAAVVAHLVDDATVERLAVECYMLDDHETADEMSENESWCNEYIVKVITEEVRVWESDKRLIENSKSELIAEFKRSFYRVGSMLQEIEGGMQGTASSGTNTTPLFIKPGSPGQGLSFTSTEKLVMGLTAPVWLPLAVITLTISLPILATIALHDIITQHQELVSYKRDRMPFIRRWTRAAVEGLTAEMIKEQVVKKRMMQIGEQLEHFKGQIPQIIDADVKLMEKVEREMRKQADIEGQYSPLHKQLKKSFGKLQYIKLKFLQEEEPDFYPDSAIAVKEKLGGGSFGEVYVVSLIRRGETEPCRVAAKVMKDELTERTSVEFTQERDILKSLSHENIIQYIGTSINNDNRFVLLIELCRCTLAYEIFGGKVPVPGKQTDQEEFVLAFKEMVDRSRQIANGLVFIHNKKFVHRDVKMSNILVTDTGVLKLSDMGQAKPESSITGTFRGTRFYRDPEVLRGGLATQQADIYSLAIIMYQLWFGFIVYSDVFAAHLTDLEAVEEEIRRGELKPHFDVSGYRHPIPEWCQLLEDSWRDKTAADQSPKRNTSQQIYESLGKMLTVEFITEKVQPYVMAVDVSQHIDSAGREESSPYFF